MSIWIIVDILTEVGIFNKQQRGLGLFEEKVGVRVKV